jgi:hypothetical protein
MKARATAMKAPTAAPTEGMRRFGRSVLAVAAGFLTTAALALVADDVLHRIGVFPPWGQSYFGFWPYVAAVTYRSVFATLGFAITAHLAPRRPLLHVGILAGIAAAAGVLGVVAAATAKMGPVWYPVALLATILPCAWLGGVLLGRRCADATELRMAGAPS